MINAHEEDLVVLAKWLAKAGLKVGERTLEAAWRSDYGIATLEDRKSPHTLDVIFAKRKLERSAASISCLPTCYEAAESLILSKLRMLKVTPRPERAATDREDIKAILEATRINLRSLRKRAKQEGTVEVLDDLMR